MTRYGMVIDVTLCIGCDYCLQVCKDEFVGNDYPPYSAAQPDTQYGYGGFYPQPASTVTPWVKPGQLWTKTNKVILGKYPSIIGAFITTPCKTIMNIVRR
jgi:Fe-S-cluster-containing dehydrogenase component